MFPKWVNMVVAIFCGISAIIAMVNGDLFFLVFDIFLAIVSLCLYNEKSRNELKRVSVSETLEKSFAEDKDELDTLAGDSENK